MVSKPSDPHNIAPVTDGDPTDGGLYTGLRKAVEDSITKTTEPPKQHAYPGRANYEPAPSKPDPFNKGPYAELERILKLAYDQSASGKGAERHASSPVGVRAWHDQPILANARQVGPGGPSLQIMKKAQESVTMAGNGNFAGAKAEALGAIVYAAALYKLYEEMERAFNG